MIRRERLHGVPRVPTLSRKRGVLAAAGLRRLVVAGAMAAGLLVPGISQAYGWHSEPSMPLRDALPRRQLTPGAVNPRIAEANIHETICVPGYTRRVRPPESYTEPLKRRLIAEYGYRDRRLGDYELDHDVPLELAGAPMDPRNLWPQPHRIVGGWGSYVKDHLEDVLHRMVCRGQLPLQEAQQDIAANWIATYRRFIGPVPRRQRHFRDEGSR